MPEAEDLQPAAAQEPLVARIEESALVRPRLSSRYKEVQALLAEGKDIKPIMRELGLAKETVGRVRARAASATPPRRGRCESRRAAALIVFAQDSREHSPACPTRPHLRHQAQGAVGAGSARQRCAYRRC